MFDAREWSGLWNTITSQIHCSLCHVVLPENATYGHGKHAIVDMGKLSYNSRGLNVICDNCYLGFTEGITSEELSRRNFIEDQMRGVMPEFRQGYVRKPTEVTAYTPRVQKEKQKQNQRQTKEIDYGPLIR